MKRNDVIQIRVSPEEKSRIKIRAGNDMSSYIREKVLGKWDARPDMTEPDAKEEDLIRKYKAKGMTTPVARREARKDLNDG